MNLGLYIQEKHQHTFMMGAVAFIAFFVLMSCSAEDTIDFSNKNPATRSTSIDNTQRQNTINLQQNCGIPDGSIESGQIVFTQSLKSLPIVVTGTNPMIGQFRVITNAQITIQSQATQRTQSTTVSVASVDISFEPFLGIGKATATTKARNSANNSSGKTTATIMPNGEWLNLVSNNPEYANLFCAMTAAKTIDDQREVGAGPVTYSPALPNAISPLAPRATIEKEIGQGRRFTITANVSANKNKKITAGSFSGVITVTPIPAQFQSPNGPSIASDIAYEVRAEFPGGAPAVGLSRSQKFFINTTRHDFEAIIDDSGQTNAETKQELPPTILIRQ